MGRVPDTDNNSRQLKHLTDQHLEMIRRSVAGQRVGKIASEMGFDRKYESGSSREGKLPGLP